MDAPPAFVGSTTAAPLMSLLELFQPGSSRGPSGAALLRVTGKISRVGASSTVRTGRKAGAVSLTPIVSRCVRGSLVQGDRRRQRRPRVPILGYPQKSAGQR